MFLRVLFFSLCLVACSFGTDVIYADAKDILPNNSLDFRYKEILESEKEQLRRGEFVEDLASGLAALTIGLYGYYNDNQGLSTKLIYSATQTAGVIMVSNTIRRLDRPSLLLGLDRIYRQHENIDLEKYKKIVVKIDEKIARANNKQMAFTSLMLASVYGYNAYRETKIVGLRNVFSFLSFNFFFVSGASFFKIWTGPELFEQGKNSKIGFMTESDILVDWQLKF